MTGMLKGYFQSNPFRQQNLKIFARGRPEFYTLIVPVNSPMKPILQKACSILQEAGTMDFLLKAWEGKEIPQIGAVEVMVLTAGQVILIFFITGFAFSLVLSVWLCELVHKKIKDGKNHEDGQSEAGFSAAKGKLLKNILPKDLLKYPNSGDTIYHGQNVPQSKVIYY